MRILVLRKKRIRGCITIHYNEKMPWYARWYLKYRGWKFCWSKSDAFDLSIGYFQKHYTSDNVNLVGWA